MLHVLQYFTGNSIAAADGAADLTLVQSVVGGPRARGSSSLSGGGSEWRFRGRIYRARVRFDHAVYRIGLTHPSISHRGSDEG